MATVQDLIKAAVRVGLESEFRKCDFRKNGMHFCRVREQFVQVFNVQSNKFNTRQEGSFTINLGVLFPALHQLVEAPALSGLPKEYQCDVRTRIGKLMPERKDHWWKIGIDTNVHQLAQELREVWETYAHPWLECNSTLLNATTELEKQEIYFRAAAGRILLGQVDEAKRMAELGLKKSPRATRAHAWARKHGLLALP